MIPPLKNLFRGEDTPGRETIASLLTGSAFKLEHIVSRGEASAPGFWYDQDEPEWVLLLSGQATLEFEEGALELVPGDSLTIPAHVKHRVGKTSPDAVWIALHHTGE